MEAIAPFAIEKGAEEGIRRAQQLILGPEVERETERCIARSVARTLTPYSGDTDLRRHLETILTDFVRRGGLNLFFLPDIAESPDMVALLEVFIELGGDAATLPESFDELVHRLAIAFSSEVVEAAQRDGSALFNVVNVRKIEDIQNALNLLTEEMRADLDHISDGVRATQEDIEILRRGRKRSERIPNAKALLNGPIRALRLQGDLNAADRHADRLQAAEIYARIAARLLDAGYVFHAHLVRQKRAEALAGGGLVEEAFRVWLNEASDELEAGRLWIAPAIARSIDTYRDSAPRSLQAKADALEALEGWYEQPIVSIRILKRIFDALVAEKDPAAAEVAMWLGEALAVDGIVDGVNLELLVPQIESLVAISDDLTSVRLRLLIAETTGEWDSLIEDVVTDALSAASSGLVLCRHGRWLALHGSAEESISTYRGSIDQLAEADLLGDTAGALRSIVMVQERYFGLSDSIIENFELAKLVSHESSRFRRSGDPRSASIEALHQASEGKHGALPNALRAARRYLWESRISGSLRAETDARRLIGDVLMAAGKSSTAINNYILGGEDKKAADLAKRSQPVDVTALLDHQAPWIVGTALTVLAAQGDYWPAELAERTAPRLVELTSGMPQSFTSPEVHVQAWAALASVTVQLPDPVIDQVLERLEPLIEREKNTYRRMDESLLNVLAQVHAFRPSRKYRASILIAHCLEDPGLMQLLEQFLVGAVEEDGVLKDAMIARANAGDRTAKTVLAAAGIDQGTVHEEAKDLFNDVMGYEVGKQRNTMVVTDRFRRAAVLSKVLMPQDRNSLAIHLLDIAGDHSSPEPHRAAAAEAIAELAFNVSEEVRARAFEFLLSLADSGPSDHLIDQMNRNSLDALSRFRFDLTDLSLPREACEAAGRFVSTNEQAVQLLNSILPMWQDPEMRNKAAACRAVLAIDPDLRPQFPVTQLAADPLPLIRRFALALWMDAPSIQAPLAEHFAVDPDWGVRKALAKAIPKLAKQDMDLAQIVLATLSRDPSAIVRAVAAQSAASL